MEKKKKKTNGERRKKNVVCIGIVLSKSLVNFVFSFSLSHFSPIWGDCIFGGQRKYLSPTNFLSPFLSQPNNNKKLLPLPFFLFSPIFSIFLQISLTKSSIRSSKVSFSEGHKFLFTKMASISIDHIEEECQKTTSKTNYEFGFFSSPSTVTIAQKVSQQKISVPLPLSLFFLNIKMSFKGAFVKTTAKQNFGFKMNLCKKAKKAIRSCCCCCCNIAFWVLKTYF